MTEIVPEAQALIDRLKRMDPANPHHDKAAIERALTALLVALGLPERPFIWAENAQVGCALVTKRVAAAWADPGIASQDAPPDSLAALDPGWDAALKAGGDPAVSRAFGALTTAHWPARATNINLARDPVWDAAWNIAHSTAQVAAWGTACSAARASTSKDDERDEWDTAVFDNEPEYSESESEIAEAGGKDMVHDVTWAIAQVNSLAAVGYPFPAELTAIIHPMFEAFEAGLFIHWITPTDIVCVLRPSLSIEAGKLHRADGPAAVWPGSAAYYFWRGVQVSAWIIEQSNRITVASIHDEWNQEIRRCMTEIYGLSRFLRDVGARLVHEDAFGKLWEAQVGDEAWRIVEVENGTPEPDGSRRRYTLDVTDAAEELGWPIETARAAVAATYGLREEEYHPEIRT